MTKEVYDDLEWSIGTFPIGSSTPDEFYENSFEAVAKCPNCGEDIEGVAQIWSDDEMFANYWLERVDYEPCECSLDSDDEEEEIDETDLIP